MKIFGIDIPQISIRIVMVVEQYLKIVYPDTAICVVFDLFVHNKNLTYTYVSIITRSFFVLLVVIVLEDSFLFTQVIIVIQITKRLVFGGVVPF